MRVKVLFDDKYQIAAVMDGERCPSESFMLSGDAGTKAARQGLMTMLEHVANAGLEGVPSSWFHEANKQEGIYEFIKGPLRLFFFRGNGRQIVVCTDGGRKHGPKADKSAVAQASKLREAYKDAMKNNTCEVMDDETE